jgi:hypothetical protein
LLPALLVCISAVLVTGCGSGGAPPSGGGSGPTPGGSTQVTLLLSGSANGFPLDFRIALGSLTLVNQSGKTVTVFTNQQTTDAVAHNGHPVPLLTATVPQDTYTSAQFTDNQIDLTYLMNSPGSIDVVDNETLGDCCQSTPTVVLASPITISGSSMALQVNLNLSKSILPNNNPVIPYRTAAYVELTAFPLTSAGAVNIEDEYGQVVSTNAAGFSLLTADGANLDVAANSATSFTGLSGMSALAAGMFLETDGSLQDDGSLQASRVQVTDPATKNMSVGTVVSGYSGGSSFVFVNRQGVGSDPNLQQHPQGFPYAYNASTHFGISSRYTNLASLPFTPHFDVTSLGRGQHVWLSIPSVTTTNPYSVATDITLVPQTLNAQILSSSTQGAFTVYNVLLPAEDYVAQAFASGSSANAVIYLDNATRVLNGVSLATGTMARFTGLLFNDGGTLRLDCDEVDLGVAP